MNQLNLNYSAPQPGRTDTSAAAAAKIAPKLRDLHDQILDHLALVGDASASETALAFGMDKLSIRPRMTELRKWGLIRDSGKRRPNSWGNNEICFEIGEEE